jgi:uncharacterized protein YegP (UPF0339 family)
MYLLKWFCRPQYKIVMLTNKQGAWYWHLMSVSNGEILANSEAYSSRNACEDTAKGLAKTANWELWVLPPETLNLTQLSL